MSRNTSGLTLSSLQVFLSHRLGFFVWFFICMFACFYDSGQMPHTTLWASLFWEPPNVMFLGDTCVAPWRVSAYVPYFMLLAVSICFYSSSCHNRAFFQRFAIVPLNLLGTGSRAPLGTKACRCSWPTCEMSYKARSLRTSSCGC